jgi:Holliday junction resolvase RusA-like endonuclease
MSAVSLTVYGTPRPQGSKRFIGRGISIEANPHVKNWRGSIADAAARAPGSRMFDGPVALSLAFYFARPKSHYRTGKRAGELKADAPAWPTGHNLGDLDKLTRATFDAVTGVLVRDDSQVVELRAVRLFGTPERMELRLDDLAQRLPSEIPAAILETA